MPFQRLRSCGRRFSYCTFWIVRGLMAFGVAGILLAWISLVACSSRLGSQFSGRLRRKHSPRDFASAIQHQHFERLPGVRDCRRSCSCGPRLVRTSAIAPRSRPCFRFRTSMPRGSLCGWKRGRRWLRLFSLQRLWSRRVLVCRRCQFATRYPASALSRSSPRVLRWTGEP
jgi:hypothetical protein